MFPPKNEYRWIPSVYFMQGLPFALVVAFSPVLYKAFGLNNSDIAFYTSLFTLPWIMKFFFSPALEKLSTKKKITVTMQFSIAVLILLLAVTIYYPAYLYVSGIIFVLIAFAAATHDISVDGLYLQYLDLHAQAKWVGIRTVFYQVGTLFCQGIMIYLVGVFAVFLSVESVWSLACCGMAICVLLFAFYNYHSIPDSKNTSELALNHKNNMVDSYKNVFKELRQLPNLFAICIFILLYNFPEAQLIKILPLFMLDNVQQGGLGLRVSDVGIVYGVVNVVSMLGGITLSGFFLNKFSLKTCLIPFTLLAVLGNASYLLLIASPSFTIWQISLCVISAQFFFGLSNGAYLLYLMRRFAKGHYAMSLYAIGTAMMLLGTMIAGGIAGYIQSLLGYTGFFVWVVLAGIGILAMTVYNVKKIL